MKDFFNNDASELKNKKLWLLDMDGTIYTENKLFDGTLEFLDYITNSGGKYVFITNNSSKSVNDYISKLRNFNIKVDKSNFCTSTQATILFLNKNYFGKKVYCQGTKSLVNELLEANITVTEKVESDIDIVLIGFDTELTSQKLRNTCEILQKDVVYIATNPDIVCPVSFGYIPDCGSICQIIYNATGKKPKYIGKPEPTMINIVQNNLGYDKSDVVVVGDRLYTDIASGVNANVTTICVLSGEVNLDDIYESNIKPTYVFNNLYSILQSM